MKRHTALLLILAGFVVSCAQEPVVGWWRVTERDGKAYPLTIFWQLGAHGETLSLEYPPVDCAEPKEMRGTYRVLNDSTLFVAEVDGDSTEARFHLDGDILLMEFPERPGARAVSFSFSRATAAERSEYGLE